MDASLPESSRSGAGLHAALIRIYTEEAVERVRIFQQFYAAGLSSCTIAKLLPCMDTGHSTAAQRDELLGERDRLARHIDTMTHALHRLEQLITAPPR
ncbi:hypothetical protein ACIA8C_41855 [Nocardia sp. NPDC051321]|uniref:hypothetical protein n=1 Tax=Nocardia sp. NPDC051321 TaxID=3364323 RepID=UPI0037B0BDD2